MLELELVLEVELEVVLEVELLPELELVPPPCPPELELLLDAPLLCAK